MNIVHHHTPHNPRTLKSATLHTHYHTPTQLNLVFSAPTDDSSYSLERSTKVDKYEVREITTLTVNVRHHVTGAINKIVITPETPLETQTLSEAKHIGLTQQNLYNLRIDIQHLTTETPQDITHKTIKAKKPAKQKA